MAGRKQGDQGASGTGSAVVLRRAGARGPAAALALAALVISPLTFFGMMFWEHTPGLFCLFATAAISFRSGEGRARRQA